MPFDVNRFNNSVLEKRTADVDVPDLKDFFAEGDPTVWVVRGLSGSEIARAQERGGKEKMVASIVEAISAAKEKDKLEAMKQIVGIGDNVPDEIVRRQSHLVDASVSPQIDYQAAVRVFEFFPIVGFQLTNKILELTGEGATPGKRARSTAKSK